MSATIILGAQWGDEGKVRQISPVPLRQGPLALVCLEGYIHSLTRDIILTTRQGKIVDVLCEGIQLCCRAQGGHNAGHTIVKDGTTFDVHILRKSPSLTRRNRSLTFPQLLASSLRAALTSSAPAASFTFPTSSTRSTSSRSTASPPRTACLSATAATSTWTCTPR